MTSKDTDSLQFIYSEIKELRKHSAMKHKDSFKKRIPVKIVDFLNALDVDIRKVGEKYPTEPECCKALLNKFVYLWEIHKPFICNAYGFKVDEYANRLVKYMDGIYDECRKELNVITGDELELTVGNVILEEGLTTCGEVIRYFNKHYTFRFNARELKSISANFHCE